MKWQPVVGFEKFYEVSSCGKVRKVGGALCGQWLSDAGYWMVRLSRGSMSSRRLAKVHRLVAEAFVPKQIGRDCVNHIDHDRRNNHASNLEWCTQSENLKHMHAAGRGSKYWNGKRSPNAKLSQDQVVRVKELRRCGRSHQEIAELTGASKRTVGRILNGETYV